ncbi:hypothetical protein DRJ00_07950 [Candidatus Aerophobetes bacterium]|uniref:DEAD/DEAH-box helicase domain-containing protein n=1 Tax=Aerophobetes bacterium TaxID=2030807 RepID=A0A497E4P8_UNCAE|nr:MAG: hypothetical protein DRJ00_07950 [Candidatus Aerophobetes bacterium]
MNVNEFYRNYLDIPTPYVHQVKTWEIIEKGRHLLLLKAPTGSGKTEAAIAPFLAQFVEDRF